MTAQMDRRGTGDRYLASWGPIYPRNRGRDVRNDRAVVPYLRRGRRRTPLAFLFDIVTPLFSRFTAMAGLQAEFECAPDRRWAGQYRQGVWLLLYLRLSHASPKSPLPKRIIDAGSGTGVMGASGCPIGLNASLVSRSIVKIP